MKPRKDSRLSKWVRDTFIDDVMDDLPALRDYGGEIHDAVTAYFAQRLPAGVKAVWDNPDERGWVNLKPFFGFGTTTSVPASREARPPFMLEGMLDAQTRDRLRSVEAERDAQLELRSALREKLRAAAYSCKTRKELREVLPELAHYLSQQDGKRARRNSPPEPPTGLVGELVRAGWPKKPE